MKGEWKLWAQAAALLAALLAANAVVWWFAAYQFGRALALLSR